MRVIHSRKKVFDKDSIFTNKFGLLTWVLSILKWKQFNHEVVLYVDTETLDNIKSFGFETLYDEINQTLLEDPQICEDIDFYLFWAMPKIFSLYHEVVTLGHKALAADTDVVPMRDFSRMYNNSDVLVWSNKEQLYIKSVYPDKEYLSLPHDYKLPNWFCGKAIPLNTGIIHFKDSKKADEYLTEVTKWARHNKNPLNNTNVQTMCNAEQRLIAEMIKHKNWTYNIVQPMNQHLFNKNAFHTHGYKFIKYDDIQAWNVNFFLMIKELSEDTFNLLINNPLFEEEKAYFEKHGYENRPYVKELEQYFK